MKNSVTVMKNTLDEININSILDTKEKKIRELEDTAIETAQNKTHRGKKTEKKIIRESVSSLTYV